MHARFPEEGERERAVRFDRVSGASDVQTRRAMSAVGANLAARRKGIQYGMFKTTGWTERALESHSRLHGDPIGKGASAG